MTDIEREMPEDDDVPTTGAPEAPEHPHQNPAVPNEGDGQKPGTDN